MTEVMSASGYLALLNEPEQALQVHALEMLNQVVHKFWFEIAECVSEVEAHYENDKFQNQPLAALVASKVRTSPFGAWRLDRLPLSISFHRMISVDDVSVPTPLYRCITILENSIRLSLMRSALAVYLTSMSRPSMFRAFWVRVAQLAKSIYFRVLNLKSCGLVVIS